MTAGRCEIVIINGSGTAGKDETIRHASRLLAGIHSVYNMSTIETVKQACRNFFGVDPEHDKSDAKRRFWSAVKAAWVQYNNGPFLEMQKMIEVLAFLSNPAEQKRFSSADIPPHVRDVMNRRATNRAQ